MKKALFITLSLIYLIPLFSSEEVPPRPKSYKPAQFIHQNIGCPMNSNCSEKVGVTYKKWKELLFQTKNKKNQLRLLNNFALKEGLPFTQWVTSKGSYTENLIVWDSHCRNHNLEGNPKIHIGLQFINNISQAVKLEKEGLAYNRFMLILDQMGRVTKRIVPRADTPLYFDGDNLVYQIEFEGNYFSESLAKNGDLSVVESITPKSFPKTVNCPKKLLEVANKGKENLTKNLYLGFFCQQTWDKRTDYLNTILLPWSCN